MRYGISAVNAAKTECVHGHPFTPENTYTYRGTRRCRTCTLAKEARRRTRPEVRRRTAEQKRSAGGKAATRAYFLRLNYGITRASYEEISDRQGGVCAICGGVNPNNKALGVDHDHELGSVRGLLCDLCNRGLGMFRDNPDLLEKARAYIAEWWPPEAFKDAA